MSHRILVVDDNKSIHDDFRKILSPSSGAESAAIDSLEQSLFGAAQVKPVSTNAPDYVIESAYQGEQALDMVRKAARDGSPYALCFMDVRMPPGWDGIQTIAQIWKEFPYTEMVICTAYSDYSWDEIVEKLGNTDRLLFLSKPFDAISVKQMALTLVKKWVLGEEARNYVSRLEREVNERTAQLQELLVEVNHKNRELEHLALHDTLTGLSNRTLFNDRLHYSINCAMRDNQKFGVLLLDLDRFKEVNDAHGHLVGDRLIQEIAIRLRDALRNSDTVARLGGDEFAVILHNVTADYCGLVANKIKQWLVPPVVVDNLSLIVGASVGAAIYPDHGDDPVALLKNADVAMYEAKRAGSGFAMFDPDENARRTNRLQLVRDLDEAIRGGGLRLYFQPIVDLSTHRVGGVEALSRWIHPEHGFIPPDQFIGLAEQKGLIQPLTFWVLETAIAQCAQWHQRGLNIGMSVNLSTRNILDPTLPGRVGDLLKQYSLEARWLKLEITEGMTMSDPERALDIIRTIDAMGVRISIDDFGTGYSSLAYMKKLPVEEVKIDRSFVMDMDTDEDNHVIVRSTIDLAHTLGMKVVAEGIESERILKMLLGLGCDKVQGYYLCKPKPADELNAWLLESPWGIGTVSAVIAATG